MQIAVKHAIAPLTIFLAFSLSACERSKVEHADKLSPEDQIMQSQVEQAAIQPFEMTADDPHDIQLLMDYEQRHDQMSNDLEDELERLHESKQLDAAFAQNRLQDNVQSALSMLKELDLKTPQGRYIQGLMSHYWEQQAQYLATQNTASAPYPVSKQQRQQGLADLLQAQQQLEHWRGQYPQLDE
ncbi:MAG: hypothetical protein QMB96_04070 [Acinetobacter towneri]